MSIKPEPVIRLQGEPIFITQKEYEKMITIIQANALTGAATLVDAIMYKILKGMEYRYNEVKRLNEEQSKSQEKE